MTTLRGFVEGLMASIERSGRVGSRRGPRVNPVLATIAVVTALGNLTLTACVDFDAGDSPGKRGRSGVYAARVCGRLDKWAQRIQSAAGAAPTAPALPEQAQQQVELFLTSAVEATDQLHTKLERIDAPDLEGVDSFHAAVIDAVSQLLIVLNDKRNEIASMQAASPEETERIIESAATAISAKAQDIQTTLQSQTAPSELAHDFDDNETCQELKS